MNTSDLVYFIYFVVFAGVKLLHATTAPCALRSAEHGYVCVCNATYCDSLDPIILRGKREIAVVSSSEKGLRFAPQRGHFSIIPIVVNDGDNSFLDIFGMPERPKTEFVRINVDRSKHFQRIEGWGGAFTGSVSYLLDLFDQNMQDTLYRSCFAEDGLAYNMLRMPIGGCDFDLEPWAYNEYPENDTTLSNFTQLDPRDQKKVQQIKRLMSVSGIEDLRIMAAAWSSPKWMKTNNEWTGLGVLKDEYYQLWADYHLRFLELMDESGLPISYISTGNEPQNGILLMALINFMSLGWSPDKQANWLTNNLGPTIKNSKYRNVQIFSNDDQKFTYPWWFDLMNLTDSSFIDYMDGFAVHWYFDLVARPISTDLALEAFPGKMLLNTESCIVGTPKLGSWDDLDYYVTNFMTDLKHSVSGFIDWNLFLNEQGGPNYVNNFVSSPIILNTTSYSEFYKHTIYYAIGHFSKFIPKGSVAIETKSSGTVKTVAFQTPSGTISTVLYNKGSDAASILLKDTVRGSVVINIPPKSLHTLVYN